LTVKTKVSFIVFNRCNLVCYLKVVK